MWLLFALSTGAGWWLIHTWPTLVGLVASPQMVRHVEHGELWTDGILNITPSSLLSMRIFTNNIAVTIFACVAGIFYGLGTFYVIANNGLMLGGVFAFTRIHGLDGDLLKFIFAHGTVELSMICLGGAAGVALGESLIRPKLASRRDSLQQCTARIARLFAALIPLLIICGLIEGFVSPDPAIGWPVRLVLGLANLGADVRGALRDVSSDPPPLPELPVLLEQRALEIDRRAQNHLRAGGPQRADSALTLGQRVTGGQRQPRIQPVPRFAIGDGTRIQLAEAATKGRWRGCSRRKAADQRTFRTGIVDVGHQHHQTALVHAPQQLRGRVDDIGIGVLGLDAGQQRRAPA